MVTCDVMSVVYRAVNTGFTSADDYLIQSDLSGVIKRLFIYH